MINELVSIITPLYNGERFVAQTIESVLAQTHPHWEMIIINDGSKDNSEAIVQTYADTDTRIKTFLPTQCRFSCRTKQRYTKSFWTLHCLIRC